MSTSVRRVAVIGCVEHDHVLAPVCGRASRSASSLASLPELSEVADAQRLGKRARSGARRSGEAVVQVARVGVEDAICSCTAAHDARVAVPDVRDVVVDVEVARPVSSNRYCIQPRTTLTGLRYASCRLRPIRARRAESARLARRLPSGKAVGGNAERAGSDRETGRVQTARSLARTTPGKSRPEAEQVEDELEVDVGRPAPVLVGGADRAKRSPRADALPDG